MSVIVKGIKIPNCCEECKFCYAFQNGPYDIYVKCTLLNRLIPKDDKPKRDDCPLIELPQHGRLIDAEELKEWINSWFDMDKYYHPYSKGKSIPTAELLDIIENIPTILEAEVNDAI